MRRKANDYIAENTKQKINSTEQQTKTNSTEQQTETTTEEHIEEIELLSESEICELKFNSLIKLNKAVQSIDSDRKYTDQHIVSPIDVYISHSRGINSRPTYKCLVKYICCEKIVPCTFNKHWQTSNLDQHSKSFHPRDKPQNQNSLNNNDNEDINCDTQSSKKQRFEEELDEILND